jgi:hypothetical protein
VSARSGAIANPPSGKNGKIKPDWVIVKGREEHHPEGNFYPHRYEGDREIWKKVAEIVVFWCVAKVL